MPPLRYTAAQSSPPSFIFIPLPSRSLIKTHHRPLPSSTSMAEIYLSFLLIFFFSPVFCTSRILPPPQTVVLEVAAATRRAHNAVSNNPTTTNEKVRETQSSSSSSSYFSLQLHPRAKLDVASHSDYRSLTLSRLRRDSARAASLAARFRLSHAGVAPSDVSSRGVNAPVTSGARDGSGEYFARVGVGSPPSTVSLVVDTGSDVTWLQCDPCNECYSQTDPVFLPSSSSSFSRLSCAASFCQSLEVSGCRNNSCLYEVSYGDGSYTVGDFVTETVTLGSAAVAAVAIGCGHTNEGLFIGSAGVLGLGGGPLSFSSQMKTSSLSYCLVDRDSNSVSTLEFGSGIPKAAVRAPLLRHSQLQTFYFVGLSTLSVGGQQVTLPPSSFELDESTGSGVIVDSGTAVTRFPTAVYDALREAFTAETGHLRAAQPVALFDTCYNLSNRTAVDVPTVGFGFSNGGSLALRPENYLIPVDGGGTFCFAFAPTSSSLSIIGNVQQQRTRVSFDMAGAQVGFSPNEC